MNPGTASRLRFSRLLAYSKGYRGRLFVAGVMMILASVLSLHLPLLTGRLIDGLTSRQPSIPFEVVAIAMVALMGGQVLLTLVGGLLVAWVDEKIVARVRVDAFSRLQQLPYSFYAEHHSGELISRVTSDVESVGWATTQNLIHIVQAVITLCGAAGWMLVLSWKLTLYACVGVPVFIVGILLLGRRAFAVSGRMQDVLAAVCERVADCTRHALLVRVFGREAAEAREFGKLVDRSVGVAMRYNLLTALYQPAAGLAGFTGTVVVLWLGYGMVGHGQLLAGDLIAFILYVGMGVGALSSLAGSRLQVIEALGAVRRLFEMMDGPAEPRDGKVVEALSGEIGVKDLVFSYHGSTRRVLDGVSFDIGAGETVVVIGPSGAGKTTLLHLICGLYSEFAGEVVVDGWSIRALNKQSLRSKIGFVPQESVLFPGSIFDNIRYGDADADADAVLAAAAAAGVADFIDELSNGLDTEVGEGGVKLSSGQRQRICLARALVRDPRILLLDEPTSALDIDSEHRLLASLREIAVDRTCVIVAHQSSVVKLADRVLVLDRGRVVEFGSLDELRVRGGGYCRRLTAGSEWHVGDVGGHFGG